MLSRLSLNTGHRLLLGTNRIAEKITTNRCLHLVCNGRNIAFKNNMILDLRKISNRLIILPFRHESTAKAAADTSLLEQIPDPPVPPPAVEEIIETIVKVHPNGEPTFASLGLCNYTSTGLIEKILEVLHINCNLPWWSAIFALTVCVRTLVFPLVILSSRKNIHLANHLPQIQKIQDKMSSARRYGNEHEAILYAQELNMFCKEKNISFFSGMGTAFLQAPIFLSCFFALRKMANLPVESLKEGGLWWFTDLTVADPYYVLPLITSLTVSATLHISLSTAAMNSIPSLKYIMRAIPFFIFPFTINFPGAILCYWVTTNFLTLMQTIMLKWNPVREFFKIPVAIEHKKDPAHSKDFIKSFKESMTNMKIVKQLEDRRHADSTQFYDAGRGPIQRTYKYNPKQQPSDVTTVLTKKKSM